MTKNSLENRWDFYENAQEASEFGVLVDFVKESGLHFYQKRANKEEMPIDEIATFTNKFYKLRVMIDELIGERIEK